MLPLTPRSSASAPLPRPLLLTHPLWNGWSALLLGLGLLLAWDASGLDQHSARLFGTAQGFPWREHWLPTLLVHQGGRLLAGLLLAGLLLVNLLPQRLLPALNRRERWVWLALTLLSLLLISSIKRISATSCPFDLAEFGGVAQYVSHWRFGLPDGGPGHCFPSGHASSAFAFLGGFFVLRRAYPRAARAWLAATLGLGLVYGLGQMVRGAHYPSHTLWTAWICWALACVVAHGLLKRR